MAVYFFYGEEEFNIEKEIEKLKKNLDPNFLEMSYKTYNNPKFPDLIAILRSQPMMFGKMLIVIDITSYLSSTLDDKQIKEIKEALDSSSENLDIVLVAYQARNDSKKIDTRKKLFKLLSAYNAQKFDAIPTYKIAELGTWITKQGKSKGIKITSDVYNALVSQIGNDLRQLDAELDKLKLYAHPSDMISAEMVKEICISNEDLFGFTDLLMQNEKDLALVEYRKLLDKKYPLEIVSTLQNQIRKWIFIKSNSSKLSTHEIARHTGMHEYVVQMTMKKLGKITLKELVKLKRNITDAEFKIKSGLALNVEEEVENALLR